MPTQRDLDPREDRVIDPEPLLKAMRDWKTPLYAAGEELEAGLAALQEGGFHIVSVHQEKQPDDRFCYRVIATRSWTKINS